MKNVLYKFLNYLSIFTISILLVSSLTITYFQNYFLNIDFHLEQFEKYDVYNNTYLYVKYSYKDMIKSIKNSSPDKYKNNKIYLDVIEDSITNKMVEKNIKNLMKGLFLYFNGKEDFLPDIYLDFKPNDSTFNKVVKIDKINLNAILFYINRSDINDYLNYIKLLFFAINSIKFYLFMIILLIILIKAYFTRSKLHFFNWILKILLINILLSLILFVLIYIETFYIKKHIYPLTMTLPVHNNIITNYVTNLLQIFLIFLFYIIFISFTLFCSIKFIQYFRIPKKIMRLINFNLNIKNIFIQYKSIFFTIILLILIFYTVLTFYLNYTFYIKKNYNLIFHKLNSSHTTSQIISVKDAFIYNLTIKTIDNETKKSISNVNFEINGNTNSGKKISQILKTSQDGSNKLDLERGKYRINIISDEIVKDYEIPSSVFYEISKPGNNILTIKLDKQKLSSFGFTEIQFLDSKNQPIPNIKIYTEIANSSSPRRYYTISNINGICIFKLDVGTYKIYFDENDFPKEYIIPQEFTIQTVNESTNTYTLKLVSK